MRAALAGGGYDVTEAHDGDTGIAAAAHSRSDIAIVDLGLPDIDGYDVARRLRERHGPAVKLIALSGFGGSEDRQRALDAGFDVHLAKPVSTEALV